MESYTNWKDIMYSAMGIFWNNIMGALPSILAAIILLIVGLLIASVVRNIFTRLLARLKFDVFTDKIRLSRTLEKAGIKTFPSRIVGNIIYWLIMLLFLITASETLGWTAVSHEISKLIDYIPVLFSALLILLIGIFIARFIRDVVRSVITSIGLKSSKIISDGVYYFLIILVFLTALDQARFETDFITSNALLLLGSILLAGAIAYGLAARPMLGNILSSIYSRNNFEEGQLIQIGNIHGRIKEITNTSVRVETKKGEYIIPSRQFTDEQVFIEKNESDKIPSSRP